MPISSLSSKLVLSLSFLCFAACGSSSKTPMNGAGGEGSGSGGAGGVMGAGTGTGGSVAFMPVEPCPTEADYVAGTSITFPNADLSYSPKCLKVAVGDTVTFTATGGDFSAHPLEASRRRGDTANNPLTTTMDSSTSRDFTFAISGFYAYYCGIHGASDNGTGMAGVIWVR